jgi:7-keto-8-aminopelargonate synthetase-like enzyme
MELARTRGWLVVVDEAHALGARGATGAGVAEEVGLRGQADIVTATLSKALGCQGGVVAGKTELISYLVNTSRSFIYTTGISPMLAGAALKALDIVAEEGNDLRARLEGNVDTVKACLCDVGLVGDGADLTHVIPLVTGDSSAALEAAEFFRGQGILLVAIRPPTVPPNSSMLRISVSAGHTDQHIEQLCNAIRAASGRFNFLPAGSPT